MCGSKIWWSTRSFVVRGVQRWKEIWLAVSDEQRCDIAKKVLWMLKGTS